MSSSKKSGCWLILMPIIIILVIISGIHSCVGGDNETTTLTSATGIKSFDFLNSKPLELEFGESDRSYFIVKFEGEELSLDDIVFVSSDESVATIAFDSKVLSSYIYYNVKAVGAGTANVHVETVDGLVKSETIIVTVAAEETTTEKLTKTTTQIQTTKQQAITPEEIETEEEYTGRTVYITPYGKKYHFSSSCAGENAMPRRMDEVNAYDACKKCAY